MFKAKCGIPGILKNSLNYQKLSYQGTLPVTLKNLQAARPRGFSICHGGIFLLVAVPLLGAPLPSTASHTLTTWQALDVAGHVKELYWEWGS